MFLGEDLLAWLVLAFGGAMAVGNPLAIVRPPNIDGGLSDVGKHFYARALLFLVLGNCLFCK